MDYFYQTLTQTWIWVLSNKQDGHLNDRHLSVCTCGHSNLGFYHRIPSKFYKLITSIKLSPKIQYVLFLMNDYQDGR